MGSLSPLLSCRLLRFRLEQSLEQEIFDFDLYVFSQAPNSVQHCGSESKYLMLRMCIFNLVYLCVCVWLFSICLYFNKVFCQISYNFLHWLTHKCHRELIIFFSKPTQYSPLAEGKFSFPRWRLKQINHLLQPLVLEHCLWGPPAESFYTSVKREYF